MFKRMIFTVSTLLLASWLFAGQAEYQDFDASAIVSAKYPVSYTHLTLPTKRIV